MNTDDLHLTKSFNITQHNITFGDIKYNIRCEIIKEVCNKYHQVICEVEIDEEGVEWHKLSPGIPINSDHENELFDAWTLLLADRYNIERCIVFPVSDYLERIL